MLYIAMMAAWAATIDMTSWQDVMWWVAALIGVQGNARS